MSGASRPDEWRPGHPRWRATVARPRATGYGAPGTGASPKGHIFKKRAGPRRRVKGPDREHPTPRANGGASPKRVSRAAIGRIRVGTGPVQRGMRWEEELPPGYGLREDADLLVLLREDGSEVAAFSAPAADPLEVIAAVWEDSG